MSAKLDRLRQKFLDYAKKLEKTDPELAARIRDKVDDLVSWYAQHRRDMTEEEFSKILEG